MRRLPVARRTSVRPTIAVLACLVEPPTDLTPNTGSWRQLIRAHRGGVISLPARTATLWRVWQDSRENDRITTCPKTEVQ
jgi:hypothetical protein